MTLPFDELLDHGAPAFCEGCFANCAADCVCGLAPYSLRQRELERARESRLTQAERLASTSTNEHAARSGGSRARR